MAVFDTGPIDNRDAPRTTQLTIRLFNTGRQPALVGIEAYFVTPTGDGYGSKTIYVLELVPINPFNTPAHLPLHLPWITFLQTWTCSEFGCSPADSVPTISPLLFWKKAWMGKSSKNMCWKGNFPEFRSFCLRMSRIVVPIRLV